MNSVTKPNSALIFLSYSGTLEQEVNLLQKAGQVAILLRSKSNFLIRNDVK